MPSFLRELRRGKSHTKINTLKTPDDPLPPPPAIERAEDSGNSNGSSTTVDTTPPSTVPPSEHSFNGNLAVPSRPGPTKRYSLMSAVSQTSLSPSTSNGAARQLTPTSPFAPRVLSVSDNSWVHQKVLLIYGQIAEPASQPMDGHIWICHHQDTFSPTSWPVSDSHFKALVHLQPGPNRLRLDFISQKVPMTGGNQSHSSWININYLPLVSSPPLDLVILLGRDSPGTFDAVPERIQREGNSLAVAVRKYKMAAYLWQAFTGEQMNRNSFGRRCFRLDEEWQQGSLSCKDNENGTMRNEAKIHIVRSDKTVAELQDLELAQQNPKGTKRGDLFGIAMEAVKNYFAPRAGQVRYVSVLLLDTHWDPATQVVRGHAALGGGDDNIKLAIFGSHALQSYPSHIEEVVPVFSDCTRTDTRFVANDCNESGSNWEAANIGIGAHMHEVGHLLGCPHQETGVMRRDYVKLNRTFTCREPYSTRTKSPGQRLCLPRDECYWHRLDCLRFRLHPCFALPSDIPLNADNSVHLWPTEGGNALVTAATGISFVEITPEGSEHALAHIEFPDNNSLGGLPKQISLSENDLRSRLPNGTQKKSLRLEIHSGGSGTHVVENFGKLLSKDSKIKLPGGKTGYRSSGLGFSQLQGTKSEQVILSNFSERKWLKQIRVHHASCILGMEFVYDDNMVQSFGKKGGTCEVFDMDIWRGEVINGFYVRAGLWIDAIQILTSTGRKSPIFGHATGGSGHTLIPPRSYTIAGIAGTCADRVDGFSIIITR